MRRRVQEVGWIELFIIATWVVQHPGGGAVDKKDVSPRGVGKKGGKKLKIWVKKLDGKHQLEVLELWEEEEGRLSRSEVKSWEGAETAGDRGGELGTSGFSCR